MLLRKRDGNRVVAPDKDGAAVELDLQKLEQTYLKLHDALHRRALRIVGSHDEADDILQEAYVSSMLAILGGSEVENYKAWLWATVRHLISRRLGSRSDAQLKNDFSNGSDTTAEATRATEQLLEVKRAVTELPRSQGVAFIMSEIHGATRAEIAEALNRSETAVKGLLARARREVRGKVDSDVFGLPAPLHGLWLQLKTGSSGLWRALAQDTHGFASHIAQPAVSLAASAAIVVALGPGFLNKQARSGDRIRTPTYSSPLQTGQEPQPSLRRTADPVLQVRENANLPALGEAAPRSPDVHPVRDGKNFDTPVDSVPKRFSGTTDSGTDGAKTDISDPTPQEGGSRSQNLVIEPPPPGEPSDYVILDGPPDCSGEGSGPDAAPGTIISECPEPEPESIASNEYERRSFDTGP